METPRKFIIAELSIRKLGSSSVLIIMCSFCLNFALPRPTRRAQVQSKKTTTLEKRQFIHVLKALKQGLKVQEKDDFLAFGVN